MATGKTTKGARDRTAEMRAFIDGEHFRYRRRAGESRQPGEVELSGEWRLAAETPTTDLAARMIEDFRVFCRTCLAVELPPPDRRAAGGAAGGRRVRWRNRGTVPAAGLNPQDRTVEAFVLTVSADEILIEAGHERGLLHGTHYLERRMADRGGPWLAAGRIERTPRFSPRITNSIFIAAEQNVSDPSQFSDDYLSLMSHFGANGVHLYVNMWDYCRNEALPELNSDRFEEHIAALNALGERTRRFGIDLYLVLNTRLFGPDHPVFRAHPDVRGAKTWIFTEELDQVEQYALCCGSERVLACYGETAANLMRAAADVAGAIVIVGGECFYHCYTRPASRSGGYTCCPRCGPRPPSGAVAELANRLAAAVKSTGRHKAFYAWPYSAFIWSGEDRAQTEWLRGLSDDVSVLCNFDTGSPDKTTGDGVILFDYNIKSVGPSEVFAAQAATQQKLGRPIFAKVETNTTPMAFFLPYLPVHHRWHGRWQAMAQTGVAGFVGQWRFYGMNGSPPEEMQYHATWNPDRTADDLLAAVARRDFGLTESAAGRAVAGWRKLSEAWDSFPWSAMMCGEREGYMRGPFHLGPAHPMILDVQSDYRLDPRKFRAIRPDLFELGEPENLDELLRQARPRYVSELMLVLPFGVTRCLDLLGRCRAAWSAGLAELRAAFGAEPTPRARMELDIVETIDIHLATTEHVIRFYDARDRLWRERGGIERFRRGMAELAGFVRDEIANARRALGILERDFRVGYGHCYGEVYDADMVRAKIRQCEYVIDREIPRLDHFVRFHLWNDYL